jgi:hypothetical protein
MSITAECPGNVVTDMAGAPLCLDGSSAPLTWVSVPVFDITSLDTVQAGEAFAAGFVIIGTCWAIGKAIGLILSVVRR